MPPLGDARVVASRERGADIGAGARVAGDLHEDVLAQEETGPRSHRVPVEPFHGEVLADLAGRDRVPLGLERTDPLHREEAQRAVGAAVVLAIALGITGDAAQGDLRRLDRALGNPARRYADLDDAPGLAQKATSVPIFASTARS
jgi:hypothetical protein